MPASVTPNCDYADTAATPPWLFRQYLGDVSGDVAQVSLRIRPAEGRHRIAPSLRHREDRLGRQPADERRSAAMAAVALLAVACDAGFGIELPPVLDVDGTCRSGRCGAWPEAATSAATATCGSD